MTFAFGPRSTANMVGVHPHLVAVAAAALAFSTVDFGVPEKSTRTLAEEQAKVAAGTSHTLKSKHIIQADGFGHAVDLVPWIGGTFTWADENAFYAIADAMREAAAKAGVAVTWGGAWDAPMSGLTESSMGLAHISYIHRWRASNPHAHGPLVDLPHFQLQ